MNLLTKFQNKTVLILGEGYTGSFLRESLAKQGAKVIGTKRTFPLKDNQIIFDLEKFHTWFAIPKADITYWCFPVIHFCQLKKFLELHNSQLGQQVIIGTTSSYEVPLSGEVNELTPLKITQPRVMCETYLRSQGATLVQAVGIVGPQRNPLNWLKRGIVNSPKGLINLIHVNDLVNLLELVIDSPLKSNIINACYQNGFQWENFIQIAFTKGSLSTFPIESTSRLRKKLCSLYLNEMGFKETHRKLIETLSF